ncbi:MAG: hypothetical protein HKP27_08065 [Myxococcales bacterium]|nr:hypothetical protein [Myxococcales bacterium]
MPSWTWALLVALAVLPFIASLGAEFTVDDHPTVEQNPLLRDIGWGVFGEARFVRTLSIMLDRLLFGMNPVGYHATNLLLHAGATLLTFALLQRFAKQSLLAFAGAALFAIHPVHVEVITNIANRKESLCFIFSLASFLAYLRTLDRPRDSSRLAPLAATAIFGILAVGSKQVAVVLPLVAAAYEALFIPTERRLLLRSPLLFATLAVAGAASLAAYIQVEMGWSRLLDYRTVQGFLGEPTVGEIALSSAYFFWRYIELLFVPVRLCPDHVADASAVAGSPLIVFAWLGLLGAIALAIWLARRCPILSFALCWIVIHLLPTVNLIPSAYALADRYLYIPSFGLSLLLVGIVQELPVRELVWQRHRHAARLAIGAAALALLAGALNYNAVWQTERNLWVQTLRCEPDSFRAQVNVGSYAFLDGHYRRAEEHFRRAVELEPEDARAHFNHGNSLRRLRRFDEAAASYAKASELGLESAQQQLRALRSGGSQERGVVVKP